jgi:DNA polymerase III epsilon subunit family exonuclease
LRRRLERIGRQQRRVPTAELAQRLLALSNPLPRPLARRLLAAALECPDRHLPDWIDLAHLESTLLGELGAQRLDKAEFIVVDLETTGVSPGRSRILEIGVVRIRAGALAGRFETLVDPGVEIPATITSLTGIDRELIRDAPPQREALGALNDFVGPGPVAFVAHNAGFDSGFLTSAYREEALSFWASPVFCTRMLSRRLLPDLGRYHLDSLCAHFGLRNRARHRAMGDAAVTADAWIELLGMARRRYRARTLGDLVELQATSPARLRKRLDRAPRAARR